MVLYVVGTPIGNMEDITYRAINILNESDVILCEDTRCSLKLLNHYGIKKKLISYHKFNEYKVLDRIIEDIKGGVKYSLISDAGMPCISDPGKILVNRCIEEGIRVDVIPGACALINGVILSGFNNNQFMFLGFLPKTSKELNHTINLIRESKLISIIYESPHRLLQTLDFLKESLGGERYLYIGRELTKMFEENFRGSIDKCIEYFKSCKIRGEFVICIDGNSDKSEEINDEKILLYFEENKERGLSNKDNIKDICNKYNLKKNYVYNLIVKKTNLT